MKSLYNYILTSQSNIAPQPILDWDGHIHTFNHKSIIPKEHMCSQRVCFMDIEFDDLDNINVLDSYKKYINNGYDKNADILLATAIDVEDIKALYNKYPNIIKGFGELKCYDVYAGEKIPYKKIKLVREIVEFSRKNGDLPVYIHWELNNTKDLTKLVSVIKKCPQVPIVLCHFGINDNNGDFASVAAMQLQREYSNVWLDLSYTALNYFSNNILKLTNYDYNRIIIGTDYNNKIFGENHTEKERQSIMDKITTVVNFTKISNKNNIKNLFGIH